MIDLATAGILVILLGFFILIVAAITSIRSGDGKSNIRGGGVVVIGPIPIIFGSDAKWTAVVIALALVLVMLSLFLTVYGA